MPEAWRDDFGAESKETAAKLDELKERIKNDGFRVTEKWELHPDDFIKFHLLRFKFILIWLTRRKSQVTEWFNVRNDVLCNRSSLCISAVIHVIGAES